MRLAVDEERRGEVLEPRSARRGRRCRRSTARSCGGRSAAAQRRVRPRAAASVIRRSSSRGRPCAAARRCARAVFGGHAGHALELLLRRREHLARPSRSGCSSARRRAGPTPSRSSKIDCEAARLAALPVEAEREAVRLVADPLQQLQPGVVPREHDRVGAARARTPPRSASRARSPRRAAGRTPASRRAPPRAGPCRRRSRRGSASAANDASCVSPGPVGEPREAARDHLGHRREVVLAVAGRLDRRTCGSAPSSAARPGRRPSSRRCPGPWRARCRSTRSGSAATRG